MLLPADLFPTVTRRVPRPPIFYRTVAPCRCSPYTPLQRGGRRGAEAGDPNPSHRRLLRDAQLAPLRLSSGPKFTKNPTARARA